VAVGTVEGVVVLVIPGVVSEGIGLGTGELLPRPGVGLAGTVAVGPLVLADGEGVGLAGRARPVVPPPSVVP
jgi:hypothetical protein